MKFKGVYDSGTDYSVGDLVLFTDGIWYVCRNDTPAAGYPCNDTLRWERASDMVAMSAGLVLDAVGDLEAKAIANPEIPESDGTYTLTATVDSGEVTYEWTAPEATAADAGT